MKEIMHSILAPSSGSVTGLSAPQLEPHVVTSLWGFVSRL